MQPGEELQNLIADLEDIVASAKSSFGNQSKKIVDENDVYQILDEMNRVFPEEFAAARRILKERDELLAHAEAQANSIVADAQQQAMILAGDQEIVRLAQKQADDIRDMAQQYERDTRYQAEEYANSVLEHLEDNLKSLVGQVSRCHQTLSENAANRTNQSW